MRSLKRNLGIAPFLVILPLHAHGGFADVAHLVIQYLGLVIVTALFCFTLSFILTKLLNISPREQGLFIAPWIILSVVMNVFIHIPLMPPSENFQVWLCLAIDLAALFFAVALLWLFRRPGRR